MQGKLIMAIVRKTFEEMKQSKAKSDWGRINQMIADGVEIEAEGDFDISQGRIVHIGPIIGRPKLPEAEKKQGTYIRFTPQVLAHLRSSGKNWQVRVSEKIEELVTAGEL